MQGLARAETVPATTATGSRPADQLGPTQKRQAGKGSVRTANAGKSWDSVPQPYDIQLPRTGRPAWGGRLCHGVIGTGVVRDSRVCTSRGDRDVIDHPSQVGSNSETSFHRLLFGKLPRLSQAPWNSPETRCRTAPSTGNLCPVKFVEASVGIEQGRWLGPALHEHREIIAWPAAQRRAIGSGRRLGRVGPALNRRLGSRSADLDRASIRPRGPSSQSRPSS